MTSRVSVVRTAVGGLLVAAAGLKLAGLAGSAVPAVGWYAQPWVQAAAAGWEIVLGAWLLGGVAPRAAWAAAVVTFLAFAGVSASLGLTGVASCGCLGAVTASPWVAFGIDAAALALLAVGRPRAGEAAPAQRPVFGGVVVGAAAVLVALGAAGSWVYGSPGAALARLRGDILIATPDYLDFGVGQARADDPYMDCYGWCWSQYPSDPTKATACVGPCMANLQAGAGCSGNDCNYGCTTSYPACDKSCKAPGKGVCGSCGCYEAKNLSNECECR